jgi:hypothetical protein
LLGRHRPEAELAVDQWQVANVLAVAESAPFLLIVRFGVFVPEDVEGVKERLRKPEQQIRELWLAVRIEADDLAEPKPSSS